MVYVICDNPKCDIVFPKKESSVARTKLNFCSPECSKIFQHNYGRKYYHCKGGRGYRCKR